MSNPFSTSGLYGVKADESTTSNGYAYMGFHAINVIIDAGNGFIIVSYTCSTNLLGQCKVAKSYQPAWWLHIDTLYEAKSLIPLAGAPISHTSHVLHIWPLYCEWYTDPSKGQVAFGEP